MILRSSAPGSKPSLTDSGIAEPGGNSFSDARAASLWLLIMVPPSLRVPKCLCMLLSSVPQHSSAT